MKNIDCIARSISDAKANWLEDVLAGLLSAGVAENEIAIQHHPDNRTIVLVRGEPKYEWAVM